MTICTNDGFAGGGQLHQVKSAVKKNWLVWTHEILAGGSGGSPYSTYKNTPYRLDKLRSALAEAQLKNVYICLMLL